MHSITWLARAIVVIHTGPMLTPILCLYANFRNWEYPSLCHFPTSETKQVGVNWNNHSQVFDNRWWHKIL